MGSDRPQHILVTGGCGFVGSNFTRWVMRYQPDVCVTVLDKLTYAGRKENIVDLLGSRLSLVCGDVCDGDLLARIVPACDAVIHFAAETHNDRAIDDPSVFLHTNVEGTYQLLQACAAFGKRFHLVSTDEVYGDLGQNDPSRFTEVSPYRPSSPYSATKAAGDMLVHAWGRTYGVAATVSNCSNNYGPYQHVEKFIPRQITNLIDGKRPKLYGDGAHVRDWVHVDDHSSAVWRILTEGCPGETYLIGAEGERTNKSVLECILAAFGRPLDDYDIVADRPGHDRRYAVDAGKLRSELGWLPRYADFEKGLAGTIEWYRKNEAWWRPIKAATEEMYAKWAQ